MNYKIFYFSTNHLQTGCMEKSNFGFFELRKKIQQFQQDGKSGKEDILNNAFTKYQEFQLYWDILAVAAV